MIARVATFELTPQQADEAILVLRDDVLPVLRTREGFGGSLFLVDREGGTALLLALWESEEAIRTSEEKWKGSPGALEELGARRTSVRSYEVALRGRGRA